MNGRAAEKAIESQTGRRHPVTPPDDPLRPPNPDCIREIAAHGTSTLVILPGKGLKRRSPKFRAGPAGRPDS